jgi:putative ABC transport system permease protein
VRGWVSRFRRRSEDEFRDEVQSHLAHLTDEFVEHGLSRQDARDAALRRFGNVTRHLERFREASPWFWIESLSQDVHHAFRRLALAPGFTAVVLLTLSVGIGTSTTIFSVVKTVLLDPLPYPHSNQLVRIVETVPADETARGTTEERVLMEEQEFFHWRASTKTLSHMAAYATSLTTVMTVEGASRSVVARVSPAIFPMLGARMSLGRPLLERDDHLDSPVVVVSTDAWITCFGASADVIGRTVRLDRTEYTVVGVLPETFGFPSRETQFWVPLVQEPPAGGRARFVNVVAHLRDNVSLQEATAEANVIGLRAPAASAGRETRQQPQSPRYRVLPLHSQATAAVAPALRLLMVAALLVMLIVVANVATLLFSRSTHVRQDTLIRRALGASRGRVIRQMLIETVIVGAGGTVIGIALSYGGLELLKAMARVDVPELFQLAARQQFGSGSVLPRVDEIAIDVSALIWAAAIGVLASVISGLAPALQILTGDCRPSARNSIFIPAAGTSTSGVRVRNVLVFGQVVVATTLLVTAVLLIRSFVRMSQVSLGYDATNVLSFQLVLPQDYPVSRKEALAHELALHLDALPGVEAAGFASLPPLAGGALAYGVFQPPGSTLQGMLRDRAAPQARSVSRGYLRAMGVRLLEGRWFDESDHAGSRPVLLVTRAVARRYFGVRSPIGVQVSLLPTPTAWTIVGVVDDVHNGMPWEEPYSQFFMDPRQALHAIPDLPESMRETAALGFLSYAVRVNGDPEEIVPEVRAALRQLDRAAALDGVMPLRDIAFARMSRPRFYAVWSGLFALAAAVLGVIGVYGTVAYAASQRTREIGIRLALGAQRSAVLRLVLSHAMGLAALGVAVGLAGALLLSRYSAGLLFGVTAADPLTYSAVACLFFSAAVTASFVPAHRATRVDPVTAIRQE